VKGDAVAALRVEGSACIGEVRGPGTSSPQGGQVRRPAGGLNRGRADRLWVDIAEHLAAHGMADGTIYLSVESKRGGSRKWITPEQAVSFGMHLQRLGRIMLRDRLRGRVRKNYPGHSRDERAKQSADRR
jgi:hypothetical protein